MGILAECEAARLRKGPPCSVALALAVLPGEDADELRAVLADGTTYGSVIAHVLQAHDLNVNQEAVNRHRRRECRCSRT